MTTIDRAQRDLFEQIFERHYGEVLAYALRRGPRSMAEDVASETFVVAWRRIDDIPAPALPWLYGVARRVLANQRRASQRGDRLSARLVADQSGAVAADEVVLGGQLLEAIGELPDGEREALMLVAWEGLSPAQAATAAGCTRVALRARLYRARRRLAHRSSSSAASPVPGGDRAAPAPVCTGESGPITERGSS